MFWPIMFYGTIIDSTVVSSDLISQPISFSNVNTKGEAEPLAVSSRHPLLLMHNWLSWKEARKGKQQAIILTPVNPNWNPLTINRDNRGRGDIVHTRNPLLSIYWYTWRRVIIITSSCACAHGLCKYQTSEHKSSEVWFHLGEGSFFSN